MNKTYNSFKLITGGLIALMASSCASIVSGTSQTIYIQAIDLNTHARILDASCEVKDSKNLTYVVNGNPSSLVISKSQGALQTTCKAKGYEQAAVGTGQTFDAWTIGNIIFWPGIIVDVVTGAVQKYPDHVTVLMRPVATTKTPAAKNKTVKSEKGE